MVIFPLAPDQTIAQMWSNGARGGSMYMYAYPNAIHVCQKLKIRGPITENFPLNGAIFMSVFLRVYLTTVQIAKKSTVVGVCVI